MFTRLLAEVNATVEKLNDPPHTYQSYTWGDFDVGLNEFNFYPCVHLFINIEHRWESYVGISLGRSV